MEAVWVISLTPDSQPRVIFGLLKPQVLLLGLGQTPGAVQVGSVHPPGIHWAQLSTNSGIRNIIHKTIQLSQALVAVTNNLYTSKTKYRILR